MSDIPLLEHRDKVLIVTRRLHDGDQRRHFVGMVQRYDHGVIRATGYAFVYDIANGGFTRRKSQRTRIFALDNHIIVFVLPDETEIGDVVYEVTEETGLMVTDHKHFRLEMNEFNA